MAPGTLRSRFPKVHVLASPATSGRRGPSIYIALHEGGTQGPWPSSTVIFPVPQVLAWPREAPDSEKNLVRFGSWPPLHSPLWPELPKPTGRLCSGQQEPSLCPPTSLAGALVGFPRCPLPWSKGQGPGWGSVEVALTWRTRAADSRGARLCNNSNQDDIQGAPACD